MTNLKPYSFKTFAIAFLALLISACQTTIIAPYDADVRNQLVRSWVKVDLFWQNMSEQPANERTYAQYQQQYRDITIDLKVLLKLNQMRPQNDESITDEIVNLSAIGFCQY